MTAPSTKTALRHRLGPIPLGTLVKTVIGVALIAFLLLWQDNGRKLLGILSAFEIRYIAVLLVLQVLLNGVSSIKWHLFLRDRGVDVTLGALFGLYLIGRFFNNFLPSMVGGDVSRVYLLGRQIKSQATSAASVTLERATGFIAMTALAILFAAVNPDAFGNPIVMFTILAAALASGATILVFTSTRAEAAADRMLARSARGIARKLRRLVQEITAYRGRRRLMWTALGYSALFQMLAGLNVYVACLGIGFEPRLLDVLVVTPAIMILAMIPVSPNNVGWWEWCFSVLLIGAGATAAEGLAVALTLRAASLVTALAGGLLLVIRKD